MSAEVELVGAFSENEEEELVHCIKQLRERKTRFRVFSPIKSDAIKEAIYERPSYVRWWVLLGGIAGVICAYALTIGTSLEWNLVAQGKPIASISVYTIIAFELMVLFGGTSAYMGWVLLSNLPTFEPLSGYRERFSADQFGLVVRCGEDDAGTMESVLKEAGAHDITSETVEPSEAYAH